MDKAARKAILQKIKEFSGDEMFHIAEGKMLDEENLIKIAESYPDQTDLMNAFKTLTDLSEQIDVSYVDVLSACATLNQTLNAEKYQPIFTDIGNDLKNGRTSGDPKIKSEIEEAIGYLQADIQTSIALDAFHNNDVKGFSEAMKNIRDTDKFKEADTLLKDDPGWFLKQSMLNLNANWKRFGDDLYRHGAENVKNVKKVAESIHDVIKDGSKELKDYGVSLMKSAAAVGTSVLRKVKDDLDKLGDKVKDFTNAFIKTAEKARDNIHVAGLSIVRAYHKAGREMYGHDAAMIENFYRKPQTNIKNKMTELAQSIENDFVCIAGQRAKSATPNLMDFHRLNKNVDHPMTNDEVQKAIQKATEIKAKEAEPAKVPFLGKALSAPFRAVAKAAETLERDALSHIRYYADMGSDKNKAMNKASEKIEDIREKYEGDPEMDME